MQVRADVFPGSKELHAIEVRYNAGVFQSSALANVSVKCHAPPVTELSATTAGLVGRCESWQRSPRRRCIPPLASSTAPTRTHWQLGMPIWFRAATATKSRWTAARVSATQDIAAPKVRTNCCWELLRSLFDAFVHFDPRQFRVRAAMIRGRPTKLTRYKPSAVQLMEGPSHWHFVAKLRFLYPFQQLLHP